MCNMTRILLVLAVVLSSLWANPAWSQSRPVVTGFTPQSGPINTVLAITGSGFAATAAQNVVYIGGARATVTTATATQLMVAVPGGATAPARVAVTNTATRLRGEAAADFRLTAAGGTLNTATFQRRDANFGSNVGNLACTDVNADGATDVLATSAYTGAGPEVLLGLGDGAGGLQVPPLGIAAGFLPAWSTAADFTGDGVTDVLVFNINGGDFSLLEGFGTGGFAAARTIYAGNVQFENTAVADFDSDGRLDIGFRETTGGGATALVLLHNQGNGTFVATSFNSTSFILGYLLGAADLTGDGLVDLVIEETVVGSDELQVWPGQTGGGYGSLERTILATATGVFYPLALADLNNDGHIDLVGTLGRPGFIGVRLRNATNTGFDAVSSVGTRSISSVTTADVDGDGDLDVLGKFGNQLIGYANNGSGLLTAGPVFSNNYGVNTVKVADFNNDGRADFVSGGSNFVSVYLNTAGAAGQNSPPTLNSLPSLSLTEDDPDQAVALSGITNGGDPGQGITLTAVSSDPSLVPNPTVNYFSPSGTGSLRLRPAPDAFGTCTITVTVSDGQVQNGTFSRTFQVTVAPVNDPPTLDIIPDIVLTGPADGNIEFIPQVPLTGISAGPANEQQTVLPGSLTVTLTGNTAVGGNQIYYTSGDRTGSLRCVVDRHRAGLLATVTISFDDGQLTNNSITRSFRIYCNPGNATAGQPKVAPTLNAIADVAANRSLSQQIPVGLTGIGDGDPSQTLPLTVTAVSSDPDLVAIGAISFAGANATTGSVAYTLGNRSGSALVYVTVNNGQATNGTVTRSFRVTVPALVSGTSTAQELNIPQVNLYPNPSAGGSSQLAIRGVTGAAGLQVFDALGRIVSQQHWDNCPTQAEVPLGPAAKPGVYVVRLTSAQGVITRRLLVE